LNHQLHIINSEQINSIGEVESKLNAVKKQIVDIESKIKGGEIEPFQIERYSELLSQLRKQEKDYQNIMDTYNESSEDYISRMVSEVKARMTEQEKDKLRHLQEQKYEVYIPTNDRYMDYVEHRAVPSAAEYGKVSEGSWYDAEGESIYQRLQSIYDTNKSIYVGFVIKVEGRAFMVDKKGFKELPDFDKPAVEKKQEKAEPKRNKPRR
jgi:hypothetical protein